MTPLCVVWLWWSVPFSVTGAKERVSRLRIERKRKKVETSARSLRGQSALSVFDCIDGAQRVRTKVQCHRLEGTTPAK